MYLEDLEKIDKSPLKCRQNRDRDPKTRGQGPKPEAMMSPRVRVESDSGVQSDIKDKGT
jgi:hypothetical protein